MKLALFNDYRVGVVDEAQQSVVDVTEAVPGHTTDYAANFWVRLCADFPQVRPAIEAAAARGQRTPLGNVQLRAPALNPSKVIAAASNYAEHVAEMAPRAGVGAWQLDFDVFLKAPSSIADPNTILKLPPLEGEIHYEGELAFVIGKEGKDIPAASALDHVLGYTILIDMTLRGQGDRSRRKSYDGFTPIGPWLVTADEVGDYRAMQIQLWLNGEQRQNVYASEMMTDIPGIIAYASSVMTLYPGDVITTGAPPGVGQVHPGDRLKVEISRVGPFELTFA
jgi:2-keto-4-pentenoate hydratase/2-oxohepta-3-ene-1,7-dioic acid hydratase in catechol pathway